MTVAHVVDDAAETPRKRSEPPLHDARALADDAGLARIALDDQIYVLRITRQGKLILTK
ncbi:MAG: hemin uptake protein HemP [Pseudomonadota bacterium]